MTTYGTGAADGWLVEVDDSQADEGHVTVSITHPDSTVVTKTAASERLARVLARKYLREHLNAPGTAIGGGDVPGSDALALVQLDQAAYDDTRPNPVFHTADYLRGVAREASEFTARTEAL